MLNPNPGEVSVKALLQDSCSNYPLRRRERHSGKAFQQLLNGAIASVQDLGAAGIIVTKWKSWYLQLCKCFLKDIGDEYVPLAAETIDHVIGKTVAFTVTDIVYISTRTLCVIIFIQMVVFYP